MPDQQAPDQDVAVIGVRARRRPVLAWLAGLLLLAAAAAGVRHLAATPGPIHIAFAHGRGSVDAEILTAAKLYLDEVNRAGGIDGHPIVLDLFDGSGPLAAIGDGPALAMLGDCPGPGAEPALPVLSTRSRGGDQTNDSPDCFRAQTPNAQQAQWLANYIRNVLTGGDSVPGTTIDLVTANDTSGREFANGFVTAMEEQNPRTWTMDDEPGTTAVQDVAYSLAREPEPRIIVIGVSEESSAALVKAIRRRGIRAMVVVNAAGSDAYLSNFENDPEERAAPGFFTGNMYTATPMIFDTIGALGQQFAESYSAATGKRPGWLSAGANDAMRIMVEALRRAHPGNTAQSKAPDREKVRAALAGIDSPDHAVPGLDGPLYFDGERDMPRSLHFGYFDRGRLVSAPLQLVSVHHPDLVDLMKELKAGTVINIGPNFYWVQRVVYAGIDIAHLNRIDLQAGTFNADVYVWLRYGGDNAAPTHIEFPDLQRDSSAGGFDPAKPAEQGELDGLNYRLYRIVGDFKADFNLHDYPFDTQSLVVRFQNHEQPREQVAYVTDTFGLHLHRPDQTPPDARSAFADLQLWHVADLRYFVHTFSISSTLGKPAFFDNDSRNEYGGFDAAIVVQRDVLAFMAKTLAPLFLLVLVVFATLFFPAGLAAERTTIPVTGFLTSAVLLVSISNSLPSLGYTMALEYMFYVFFGLCLMAMCAGFVSEVLRNHYRAARAAAVDHAARIVYVSVVAVTTGFFVWRFALR
nr:ABC transporter substrate-binding protein [uncultured Rhodopila sp.]